MQEKALKQFTGLYPVSKTLRFELKPQGKTQEWIERNGIIDDDQQKADDYPKVKKLIDEYHKYCIEQSLNQPNKGIDWSTLADALRAYKKNRTKENEDALEKEQKEKREAIYKLLTGFQHYKELTSVTPKDLINKVFPEHFGKEIQETKTFARFATYFKGFQENRNNIYSIEPISTSVPYRVVHDNFPKFLANIDVFNTLTEICPEVIEQAEKEMLPFLNGVSINDIFNISFYNSVLSQSGIDYYNSVIGGVSIDEKQKYRGINEFANLYRQQHPDIKLGKTSLSMIPLFKQILSDRETYSYIPQEITDDQELIKTIESFYDEMVNYHVNGTKKDVINEIRNLIKSIISYDKSGIYINSNYLPTISQKLYGSWNIINEHLYQYAISIFGQPEKSADKKKIEQYLKRKAFSLQELSCLEGDVTSYFDDIDNIVSTITSTYLSFKKNIVNNNSSNLIGDSNKTELIKDFLDSIMTLTHKVESVIVPMDYDLNLSFYNNIIPLYEILQTIIPVYSKIRNYMTRKPTDTKKFKLSFDAPTLADGWDQNKEKDNKAILLFKEGKSFIAITPSKTKIDWNIKSDGNSDVFKKMIYKYLPGPNKTLPHVFFSKKGIEIYKPSQYILEGFQNGLHKQGDRFDEIFLHNLIDFFKESINKNPDWKNFNFQFSDTKSYKDINSFYNEISAQGYKLTFKEIPSRIIDKWVDEGKLYLFQIYNKDYADGAHGRKNLHTLYWENLFTDDNLKKVIIKLNGEAELFYRKESVTRPIVHKVGEKMLNKRDNSGMPIPDSVYQKLYNYYNGHIQLSDLSTEEQQYLHNITVKEVSHEIVKDKRYTHPVYLLHVPITINYLAQDNIRINEKVADYIKDNPSVNIIGIDRGERHLIYLTLINQKGEILKQKTFNYVNGMNYNAKLTQREKERDAARKSWKTVGKIKDLKEGFLSAVIHEITTMMIENNAIVVLEDLNVGFKRGRFKVERQVYQKFEKMLIDKLNYLTFKDQDAQQDGGILKGYQLTQKFVSFKRIGKQNGFLFYIPAAYTSKIDPTSGFVNIFNTTDITNAEKKKEFFMKFEEIKYVSDHKGYIFTFDYDKFKTFQTDSRKIWTISTRGKRIVIDKGQKQMIDFYPTTHINDAFSKKGITIKPGEDIKDLISKIEVSPSNAGFFNELFYSFEKTLQLRNSNAQTEEDFILSPVCVGGKYYCSIDEANKGKDKDGNWNSKLPVDADANGAYHIALKGLLAITGQKTDNATWLEYAQKKPYLI